MPPSPPRPPANQIPTHSFLRPPLKNKNIVSYHIQILEKKKIFGRETINYVFLLIYRPGHRHPTNLFVFFLNFWSIRVKAIKALEMYKITVTAKQSLRCNMLENLVSGVGVEGGGGDRANNN